MPAPVIDALAGASSAWVDAVLGEPTMKFPSHSGQPAARDLIVCCDGTNDTLTAGANDTNVLQLVAHLNANPKANRIVYYDPGVGSPGVAPPTDPIDWAQRTWQRVSGLASGRGVYENIALGYLFLMRNWRGEHDRIFCFGFSRGAFTARSIAGMVDLFGILDPAHEALIPTLISIYFAQPARAPGWVSQATRALHLAARRRGAVHSPAAPTRELLALQVRHLFATPSGRDAWVHWIGVWDTVESVGLPGPLARTNPDTARVSEKRFRHVRHALSLDEHRWSFEPRMFEEHESSTGTVQGQSIKQRWFPGVHSDVGGGYPVAMSGLADAALAWMVGEVANELDIPPLPSSRRTHLRHDPLWESPWWALAGMSIRHTPATQEHAADHAPPDEAGGRPPRHAAPQPSVWAFRRKAWPLATALLGCVVFVLLTGWCLGDRPTTGLGGAFELAGTWVTYSVEHLAAIRPSALAVHAHRIWIGQATGWAAFWQFGLLLSMAYLLARAASRAFTWLAGTRRSGDSPPAWRHFGMAPMLTVLAQAVSLMLLLASLAMHGTGAVLLAKALLWLSSLSMWAALAGLCASAPLLAIRLWIATPFARGLGVASRKAAIRPPQPTYEASV